MTNSHVIDIVEISGYRLDRARRRLTDPDGAAVHLSTKAFDTLAYLVTNPGRVIEKCELLDTLWPGVAVEENTLNQAISAIRRALGDDRTRPRFIATIQGRGYQWVASVNAPEPDDRHAVVQQGQSEHPAAGNVPSTKTFGSRRLLLLGAAASVPAAVALRLSGILPGSAPYSESWIRYEVGQTRQLTHASTLEIDPAISADGRFFAYAAGVLGKTDIFVRRTGDADAGNPTDDDTVNLTQGMPGSHSWPRWSPDGEKIAFLTRQPNSHDTICWVPAEGGAPTVIVRAPNLTGHDWSPDGSHIAYTRVSEAGGVYIKQIASDSIGRPLMFAEEAHSPAWSPDGRWIAFVSENYPYAFSADAFANKASSAINVIAADGGDAFAVTDDASLNASPSWVRDSCSLLFVSDRYGMPDILQVRLPESGRPINEPHRVTSGGLNAHGLSLSRDTGRVIYSEHIASSNVWRVLIPKDGPVTTESAEEITSGNQIIETFDVSSDGKWLVYDSDISGNPDIYKMELSSRRVTHLTRHRGYDFAPCFSRDGDQIAFHAIRHGSRDLFTMLADGTGEQQITAGPADDRYPSFSPDGRKIAFLSYRSGRPEVYTMSLRDDGTGWAEPKQITFTGGWWPKWSPNGEWIACTSGANETNFGLEVVSPEDGRVHRAFEIDPEMLVRYPVWSRDGQTLYAKAFRDGESGIWSFPLSGEAPAEVVSFGLSSNGYDRLEFAVDETYFYFARTQRASDIRLLELSEMTT